MKGFRRSLILFLGSVALVGCSNQTAILERTQTNEQWIEDIDFMVDTLIEVHPNPFTIVEEEDWRKAYHQLKEDISSLSERDIQFKMAELMAMVKDAHTSFWYIGDANSVFPVNLEWFEHDLFVTKTTEDYQRLLGMKLIEINSVPIDEVISKINTLVSFENNQAAKELNQVRVSLTDILTYLNIVKGDTAEFGFENTVGESEKVTLTAMQQNDYIEGTRVTVWDQLSSDQLMMSQQSPELAHPFFWYEYFPNEGVVYLQYNSSVGDQAIDFEMFSEEVNAANNSSIVAFEEITKEIQNLILKEEGKIKKVVIDVRNNTGANSSGFTAFAKNLKLYQQKYPFDTYALIGPTTFSSGTLAGSDVKILLDGVLIGEETGGNATGFGNMKNFTLPNSQLTFYVSTELISSGLTGDGGIMPDIEVTETFNDSTNGIDAAYEAALKMDGK